MILEQGAGKALSDPINAWKLQVGREICGDVQAGLDREWLVTNGLGGYASGSLVGATTRSHHGLLVAALRPPIERMVLVTKIDEEVILPDRQVLRLGVNEYANGTIEPEGYHYLASVSLEGTTPCFTYRLNEALALDKRIWMEYGQNTTYVQYVLSGDVPENTAITLVLYPYCLARDYHASTRGSPDWQFHVEPHGNSCVVRAYDGAPTCRLIADPQVMYSPSGHWYWHVRHRRDEERGLPDQEDVYQPGHFSVTLSPGQRITLVLSAESDLPSELGTAQHDVIVSQALIRQSRRIKQLLSLIDPTGDLAEHNPILARLAVAADQFVVARPSTTETTSGTGALCLSPSRKTIIAGYPWLTDWGRDSMISLPGLLLSTGRYSEARGLLKSFASYAHNGLIPNRFPDYGEDPEYNTADATLWMFYALDRYLTTSGDWSLLKELFPILCRIIEWHVHGTSYTIGMDPRDGLLSAGAPGVQLTWMDQKVGDWVVTPRRGKPVEINALWYQALTLMESWAVRLSTDATMYSQWRMLVRQHFARRYWYEQGGYLYDVVDVDGRDGQHDASLRPNQLLAASLTHDLLTEAQISSMLQQVTQHLLTPVGLRTLSPTDPAYQGQFMGDQRHRKIAYHQGAVWHWLIGPYIDVYWLLHKDRQGMRALLKPLLGQLWGPCLGSISEVAEPEPPFTAAGCYAQAWSVAEILRCWRLTET